MVGVTNIQINESKAELEALLQKSQNLKDKERLQVLSNSEKFSSYSTMSYWCSDESRFGLHTRKGRMITTVGTKPIGHHQWSFK